MSIRDPDPLRDALQRPLADVINANVPALLGRMKQLDARLAELEHRSRLTVTCRACGGSGQWNDYRVCDGCHGAGVHRLA